MKADLQTIHHFVEESNYIEDIDATPYQDPLYDDHLAAAKGVATISEGDKPMLPKTIHRMIMQNHMPDDAGRYRIDNVRVGPHVAPDHTLIQSLMEDWQETMEKELEEHRHSKASSTDDKERFAWRMHHSFELIHPFIDGNGRTGRLLLNAIRLSLGLDWLTIKVENRQEYYQMIIDYKNSLND